jgi:MFS family permease
VLVFCGALPVGVGYVWASVLLARLGARGWVITAGLLAFTAAEMLTRILVGQLSKRFTVFSDPVRLALFGGVVGLLAIALIALPGEVWPAIAGFALLAAATAPLGPLVQSAAPRLWPTRKGAAAALVTRYSYTALVAGPVIIGPLSTALGSTATATPLRIALGSLGILFVVVIVLRRSVSAAHVVTSAGGPTEAP